jgi:hypothetical protein
MFELGTGAWGRGKLFRNMPQAPTESNLLKTCPVNISSLETCNQIDQVFISVPVLTHTAQVVVSLTKRCCIVHMYIVLYRCTYVFFIFMPLQFLLVYFFLCRIKINQMAKKNFKYVHLFLNLA